MFSMLIVSASGTFGRFFYTKIHHGLYGRLTTVNEIRAELEQSGDVEVHIQFCAGGGESPGGLSCARRRICQTEERRDRELYCRRLCHDVVQIAVQGSQPHPACPRQRKTLQPPRQRADMEKRVHDYRKTIESYLHAVRDAAQFGTYEHSSRGGAFSVSRWFTCWYSARSITCTRSCLLMGRRNR